MSSKTKWIVGVVVIVVAGVLLWKGGILGGVTPASQSGTAANATAPAGESGLSNPVLIGDVAVIDAQIKVATKNMTSLSRTLSAANLAGAAAQMQVLVELENTLAVKLQSRVASAGTAEAALKAVLGDMTRTTSNASSQITAAANNSATATATDVAALQQARAQLQTALGYIQTARKNAGTIVQAVVSIPSASR